MPFTKKDPQDLGKVRTVRVSDRIYTYIVKNYGNLAEYCRQAEQLERKLKNLSK